MADRLSSPVISDDIKDEIVPTAIRKGEAFLDILNKIIIFLQEYIKVR